MPKPLSIALFEADVTPPVGSPLCFGFVKPAERVTDPLKCRGVVFMTDSQPVVLCAIDWLGISNGGYAQWRDVLAHEARTTPSRVLLHAVHQHNAPAYDPTSEGLLKTSALHNDAHVRQALGNVATAVREAVKRPVTVTHLTAGAAAVEKVASNRRIIGADGKAKTRFTACHDAALRAEPEGLIDPLARVVGLWNGDKPIVRLSWYATHPQSFYNDGLVTWDFPGMARAKTQGMAHVHFTGAAGDIGAGKYNDGSPANRPVLAQRLADGIERAWQAGLANREAIDSATFDLRMEPVVLPLTESRDWEALQAVAADASAPHVERAKAARLLTWRQRCSQPIELTRLHGAGVNIVGLPGEPSIEYQLAAAAMRPGETVCVAGYGEYGPSYICAAAHYAQGGYEAQTSYTSPAVEGVLVAALRRLMA